MKLPLLYSRTSKGKVQTWQIFTAGKTFYTIEGLLEGTLTTSLPTICLGKNIGKANETTPEEQTLAEAQSKWQKKVDSGYYEDIADIDKTKFFEPMLAHEYTKNKDKIKFPVYSQPKLDGMRCPVDTKMWSRNGKSIVSAPHILDGIECIRAAYFPDLEGITFDGELYADKLKNDFDTLIGIAKKTKPTEADIEESKKSLEYWIYDGCGAMFKDLNFGDRIKKLENILNNKTIKGNISYIKIVETTLVNSFEELDALYEKYMADGYEGQMVRSNSPYQNKRTNFLLKRKEFKEEDFILKALLPGRGNRAGMATKAVMLLKDGRDFEVGMIGSHKYCVDLLKNESKYIGKKATIRFQNYTPDGIPRFGKLKIIRDYE